MTKKGLVLVALVTNLLRHPYHTVLELVIFDLSMMLGDEVLLFLKKLVTSVLDCYLAIVAECSYLFFASSCSNTGSAIWAEIKIIEILYLLLACDCCFCIEFWLLRGFLPVLTQRLSF